MALKDASIKRKLTALFLLTSGVVLLLTSVSYVAYEYFTFRQTTLQQVSTLGQVIASNSTAAVAFGNDQDAGEILAALRAERHIQAAALYDQDGKLFSRYPASLLPDAFPAKPERDGYRFERSTLVGFQPIAQESSRRLGTLYLKSDMGALYERFRLYSIIGVAVAGVSLIAAFMVSAAFQRQISEPILALTSTAHAIADRRDYSVRAVKSADDELGVLTDTFNQMLTRIDEQDRALRASEAIIESASDAIISKSLDGTIQRWNAGAEQLFGYQSEDIVGRPGALLIPDDRVDEEPKMVGRILRGEAIGHFESVRRKKDGTLVPVSLRISPVKDANGRITGVSKIVRDITERKRAEERLRALLVELERSNKELEQFAYVASHDLQEPLRMVSSYTQLLEQRYRDKLDDDAREFIGYAVDGARRMQRLINDLLEFSRVGTRGRSLEAVDANEVLGTVRVNLNLAIEETGALLTNDELPTVWADRTQLGQVLQNLIANAIKFHGPESPHIHVAACDRPDEWVFTVKDNGIGIDREYFDRIFVIFQRLHAAAEYPGTGIGLAVCKRIVERHGGRMWVESQPGRGSTFSFSLPKRSGAQQ